MRYTVNQRRKVETQGRARLIRSRMFETIINNSCLESKIPDNYLLGKRCFLIGGGPSLKGFDFRILNGEITIGVNRVFEFCNCTMNYSMDPNFSDRILQGKIDPDPNKSDEIIRKWRSYLGIKVALVPIDYKKFEPDIYLIRRNREEGIYRTLKEGIFPGNNSGFGALMLAILLGANPIYLLGYDFDCSFKQTHFHTGYQSKSETTDEKVYHDQLTKLESFRKMFEKFAGRIRNLGISVYNLNPNSKLTCFPFKTIDDVLEKGGQYVSQGNTQ